MRVGIGTDHGGLSLKQQFVGHLRSSGHDVLDFGAYNQNLADDYPGFVIPLAQAVAAGIVERTVAVCGSGVGASICVRAHEELLDEGIRSPVVSMPSRDIFDHQDLDCSDSVLPPCVRPRVAVEQVSTFGWDRHTGLEGRIVGMRTFGASAPLQELQKDSGSNQNYWR